MMQGTPWFVTCREQYTAFGLHHIVSAVSFLNNDCKLVRACNGSGNSNLNERGGG